LAIRVFSGKFPCLDHSSFGSEGILIYLVQNKFNIPALVLIASVGNFLGACTSYYIGFKEEPLFKNISNSIPKN